MSKRRIRKRFARRYCTLDFLECIDFNAKGQGIVIWHDKKFFVDNLIPGEKARIIVFYEDYDSGEARAIMLEKPSFKRALDLEHPKLELGLYQLAHLKEEFQDEFKNQQVKNLFGSQALDIIVKDRKYYRNKISLFNGGFKPPGKRRRFWIVPTKEQFDLMDIDLSEYKDVRGDLIIRVLDTKIVGKPGDNLSTIDHFGDKVFNVNLNSFYQVNSKMALIAYEKIKSFVPDNSIVFDLFAGGATIGIFVSDKAKEVYAVELNKSSHQDALVNIGLNKANNVKVICQDVNVFLNVNQDLKPDVIILDPSRAGLDNQSLFNINKSLAKRIIYLSCNIATQKRDIDLLTNYKIFHIQPYDFFPQTYHIENLVILDLK